MGMMEEVAEDSSSMEILSSTLGFDNSTTTNKPTEDPDKDIILGAIIGAVVGTIVLLLVCIICCSCRKRDRGHRPMDPAVRGNPRFNQELRRRLRASRNYVADRFSRIINRNANTSTTSSDRAIIENGAQRQESNIEEGVPSTDLDVTVAVKPQGKRTPGYVNQAMVAKAKGKSSPGYVNQALVIEKEREGVRGQNGSPGYIHQPRGVEEASPPPGHTQQQKDHRYINVPNRHDREDIDSAILPPEHRHGDPRYINLGPDGEPIGIESDYINPLAAQDGEDDDYQNNEFKRQEALEDQRAESRSSSEHSYENCEFSKDGRELYENGQRAVELSRGTSYVPNTLPLTAPMHPRPPGLSNPQPRRI